jgi:4-hydroxyphenylpyruvate dioxygenase
MKTDTTSLELEKIVPEAEDFLPLLGTDHIELYVGNAKQAAHYYMSAWGFQPLAYCGLETGVRDRVSYVLEQDKIRLVLTSPLGPDGEINEHINKHGDGVKTVALWVDDATKSWEETTSRGGISCMSPEVRERCQWHSCAFRNKNLRRNVAYFRRAQKLQWRILARLQSMESRL